MAKLYRKQTLANMVGCSQSSLMIYIQRAEFSHIRQEWYGHLRVFRGVRQQDISRLRYLIFNKRGAERCV